MEHLSYRSPIRSLLAVIVFLAVVGLLLKLCGCVTVPVTAPERHQVVIKVDGPASATVKDPKAEPEVRKTMVVPYTDPELPGGSYVIGGTCYMQLWAYVSASDALNLFKTMEVMKYKGLKKLHILINSGGGSAFDGMAVSDLIMRAGVDGIQTITEANGVVASAAVPIFAAGAKRISSKGTVFMLHDIKIGKMFAYEGKDDLRSQQEMIDIEEKRYCGLLSERSKLSVDQIKEMCRRTTWFTAEKAMEWGFVDEIR